MDNRREDTQTTNPESKPSMPLAKATQRVYGSLSADWIDINLVKHQWVKTFLQNLESPLHISFLPAIEDLVIWIAAGNQRVAASIYRAATVLQRELDQSSTKPTDSQASGISFHRALKCLKIAKWNSARAKAMLIRVTELRAKAAIERWYLEIDRLHFINKFELDPCRPADTQMSQQMQSVVQEMDAIMSAHMMRADQSSEAGRTEGSAAQSL